MSSPEQSKTGFHPVRVSGFHPEDSKTEAGRIPATPTGWNPVLQTQFIAFDEAKPVIVKERHLPHWRQVGATYFVTFRLADAMPAFQLAQWKLDRDLWLQHHPRPWEAKTLAEYRARFTDIQEAWLDLGHGSCVLKKTVIRQIVVDALEHFSGQRYVLDAYVVMPNHVHVLIKPLDDHELSEILGGWKRFTAREINTALGLTGAFWMEESHDHLVRDAEELSVFRSYIANNPGKAGLQEGSYSLNDQQVLQTESESGWIPEVQNHDAASKTGFHPVRVSGFHPENQKETGSKPVSPTGYNPVLPAAPTEMTPDFPLYQPDGEPGWQKLPGKMVHAGRYVQIEECSYLTPARPETPVPWTIAHRKSAIAVAPITEDGRFILIHQERLPVQRTLWEFPAGQIDEDETRESILDTVVRELEEEAGCILPDAGKLTPLGWFFGSQGFTAEHVYLFAARPVQMVRPPQPVGGEYIGEVRLVTSEELRHMVATHIIQDALTLALFARMAAIGMV